MALPTDSGSCRRRDVPTFSQSANLSRLRERGTTHSVVERGAPCAELAMRSPDFIRDRAKSLRRTMTQPERLLWSLLRRGQLGMRFRRQHPIGPYVLDFYCASARLCIEIDGPGHVDQSEKDARRTEWLVRQGIRVLRFSPNDLDGRPAAVLKEIAQAAPLSTTPSRGPPLP